MIEYSRFELTNGLRVLVHEDASTPMVAVNVLYNVGARDESPDKTGFAHLFEHLMFGGSANVPDFDEPIQNAGGENNAFTNNDFTNFYDILPAENIETAFWLESDRMLNLNFDEQVLEVQRKVVVEEFKESCLNQPYGDVWHHLADMAYKVHPYRWPTIGKVPKHVEEATMDDVKDFFYKYYRPNNAILVVAGNATLEQVRTLAEKWFGDIPSGEVPDRLLPKEPPQRKLQQRINQANVPVDAIYLAFHTPARTEDDYYACDLLSDILSNGPSSRLYRRLLKEQRLVTHIDCYITGSIDPGLFIIEAKPGEGIPLERVEAMIWQELNLLKKEPIAARELEKIKNKVESTLVFSENNILNKAINLAFFELLGNPEQINTEVELYRQVSAVDIQNVAQSIFTEENCSALHYKASSSAEIRA
ncbi:MAG: insulinase family protein [Saprospiraceae bacterium]|nr:insulinase family protein [Saprospiraceae bacterium]MCB0622359.1 insulinase family protein [Saprospiraceae bacterium]